MYSIPIIFYAPDGSIAPALRDDIIVQQTDITPTLLHLLGYSKPYLAFGNDVLSVDPAHSWAFNYNAGIYQLVKGDLLLQFDGDRTKALYRFKSDPLLRNNLAGQLPEQQDMELFLKASPKSRMICRQRRKSIFCVKGVKSLAVCSAVSDSLVSGMLSFR